MSRIIVPRRDLILPNRHKQRGFIMNPYRFGVPVNPTALSIYNKIVAWWEHSGNGLPGAAEDRHAGGFHAVVTGSFAYDEPALASGLPKCAKFTSNDTRMEVSHAAALNLNNDFSIMSWFKRDGSQVSFPAILAKPTDAFNGRATYSIFLNALKPVFRFNSGGSYYDATGATTIADLTAYQIIGTKLTTGSQLYLNNALDGSQVSGGTPDTASNILCQGRFYPNNGLIGWKSIDALFSPALTASERGYLYNSGNGIGYDALKTAAGL